MTSPTIDDIDDYVRAVGRHLRLRGFRRARALADLREALAEAAQASSTRQAVADAGPAADYAANLDEQFGTSGGAFRRILGVPNSFGPGIGRRLASAFDPTDQHLIVPRIFGAGWTVNMGAVAVRLGLLRPDDVDDDILASAADHHLGPSRVFAAVSVAFAVAAAAGLYAHRRSLTTRAGRPQRLNIAFGMLFPVGAAALLVASTDTSIAPAQRIILPANAAHLALVTAGSSTQLVVRPRGAAIVLTSMAAADALRLLLSYLPVRAALAERWGQLAEASTANEPAAGRPTEYTEGTHEHPGD